ncbi:MAG: response regulator [Thermodesulfobacteriota bacterium]
MKTILIVDDNVTLAYMTARNLQEDIPGVEVVTVESCADAHIAAERHQPALVIADVKLADGNGLELLRKLSKRLPKMAAIVTSGMVPPACWKELPFEILEKPYETVTLVAAVKRALSRVEAGEQTDALVKQPRREQAYRPGYNRHQLQNRLAALLAGLRAFASDLVAEADDPTAVRLIVAQQVDRLCSIVKEVSCELRNCPSRGRGADD